MRALTMHEAMTLVNSCEVEPDLIATNGKTGEVHFSCHRMTADDWKIYAEFVTGADDIDLSTITARNDTIEGSDIPSVLVIIKTEN